jgi:CRP/FNR family cyclic AMP-dependent transcriptional regulator
MLENVPIFAQLDPSDLEEIAQLAVTRAFPKNAVVVTEGDLGNSMYIIAKGRVKVFLTSDEGKEVILNTLGPNGSFGELALLDDEPRSASVMTLEPSSLMIISRPSFERCLADKPKIAVGLIRALVQRVRGLTENVRDLALSEVYGRVVSLFGKLAVPEDGKQVIRQRLTHQEIANMVGASREMISKILKDLAVGGYITIDSKIITLNKRLPAKW